MTVVAFTDVTVRNGDYSRSLVLGRHDMDEQEYLSFWRNNRHVRPQSEIDDDPPPEVMEPHTADEAEEN